MEGLHITIKDNVTGEIMFDEDAKAIIGAVVVGDGMNRIGYTRCNGLDLCMALAGAEEVIEMYKEKEEKLKRGVKLIKKAMMKAKKRRGNEGAFTG